MMKFTIEAPWYTFQKKVKALFERDQKIIVGEIYETEDGSPHFAFDIEVRDHEKFLALDRVMPKTRTFGNVTLGINLYDEENANGNDNIDLFDTIFRDNPIVKNIEVTIDFAGTEFGFVCFKPEVIQFPDDNIADFNGNWSGLAQDIAQEVFNDGFRGVYFCTAEKDDAEAEE